jgi:hypothetical protein
MPRCCSVCAKPERELIDQELLQLRVSNRAIARRFCVSRWSVDRHGRNHLGPLIEANRARYEERVREGLDQAAGKVGRFLNAEVDRLLTIALPLDPSRRWSGKASRARQKLMDIALGGTVRKHQCRECRRQL